MATPGVDDDMVLVARADLAALLHPSTSAADPFRRTNEARARLATACDAPTGWPLPPLSPAQMDHLALAVPALAARYEAVAARNAPGTVDSVQARVTAGLLERGIDPGEPVELHRILAINSVLADSARLFTPTPTEAEQLAQSAWLFAAMAAQELNR